MRHSLQLQLFLTVLPLLLSIASLSSVGQNSVSSVQAADWEALIPQIQQALGEDWAGCHPDHRAVSIVDSGVLKQYGVPVALVDYCQMGAYSDDLALIWLEDGKPVLARFRDEHGKPAGIALQNGSSVIHGSAAILLPQEDAIVGISWVTNSNESDCWVEKCEGKSGIWNPQTKTFDITPVVSPRLVDRECRKLRQELECSHHPSSPPKP